MIYVTGDTHGDLDDLLSRNIRKLKKGDKLIITGDFGFIWDNSKKELNNLKALSKKKFDILFVEGAHENFKLIKNYKEVDLFCSKGYKIDRNIYCLKRGNIYAIDGKIIFALGGGADPVPLDDHYNESESMPTDEELEKAVKNLEKENKHVDIIITHEAPASFKRLLNKEAVINDLNLFLDTVLHNTKFDSWYFGSLHADRTLTDSITCVWHDVIPIN